MGVLALIDKRDVFIAIAGSRGKAVDSSFMPASLRLSRTMDDVRRPSAGRAERDDVGSATIKLRRARRGPTCPRRIQSLITGHAAMPAPIAAITAAQRPAQDCLKKQSPPA
jgi:hypothetical protein